MTKPARQRRALPLVGLHRFGGTLHMFGGTWSVCGISPQPSGIPETRERSTRRGIPCSPWPHRMEAN
jgi:hypothetical protein